MYLSYREDGSYGVMMFSERVTLMYSMFYAVSACTLYCLVRKLWDFKNKVCCEVLFSGLQYFAFLFIYVLFSFIWSQGRILFETKLKWTALWKCFKIQHWIDIQTFSDYNHIFPQETSGSNQSATMTKFDLFTKVKATFWLLNNSIPHFVLSFSNMY